MLRQWEGLLLKSVSRLSEFGSIRIGLGLVRPFDRLRAVSEVEPQAHYKSATFRFRMHEVCVLRLVSVLVFPP